MDHFSSATWETDRGWIQFRNNHVKIIHAVKKFIATPANTTISLFHSFAVINVFGFWNACSSVGSSHSIEQNHHNGIQFRVNCVHCLSFRRLQSFGGIQIQNSDTFIQHFLAAIKCQNSWITTRIINTRIHSIISRRIGNI